MSGFSDRRRALIGNGEYFPPDPGNYPNLEQTFTSSGTFTAAKDGWYEIQLYGSALSGGVYSLGGTARTDSAGNEYYTVIETATSGGGSGGGGFSQSRVKLYEGDTVVFVSGGLSGTWTATINSSAKESYSVMSVTSSSRTGSGAGGTGGKASGGNYSNVNGGTGSAGTSLIPAGKENLWIADYTYSDVGTTFTASGGAGGAAATSGSRVGKVGMGLTLTINRVYGLSNALGFYESQVSPGGWQNGYARVYSGEYGG